MILKTKKKAGLLATAVMLLGLMAPAPVAQADISIMPIRTVFKDRDRMKGLTIVNTSDKPATFQLSFYYQKQVEAGGYENKEDKPLDPKYDVAKWIVYSPRQIVMAPQENRVVRLSLRKPADLPDGEYRVHLKLKRLPNKERPEDMKKPAKGMSMVMSINIGFSVPVIIRQGKYDATASISDFKLAPSPDGKAPPKVSFFINRKGLHSTLGRVNVYWTPQGGRERHVGVLNDINVYAESPRRAVDIALTEMNVAGGTFRVVYDGSDADTGKMFDEKTFPAQG